MTTSQNKNNTGIGYVKNDKANTNNMKTVIYSKRFFSRMFVVNLIHEKRLLNTTNDIFSLYQHDTIEDFYTTLNRKIAEFKEVFLSDVGVNALIDIKFSETLIKYFKEQKDKIDELFTKYIDHEIKVSLIEDILLCGIGEILGSDVEYPVIVSSYTDICAVFSPGHRGVVNKILDIIGKLYHIRKTSDI
jgi:transcription termination factor NusB